MEPAELPWFERHSGEKSPGSMCFKYNYKPMQLLSQISTTSFVSLHLDGNFKVNSAICDSVDTLAGGTWGF